MTYTGSNETPTATVIDKTATEDDETNVVVDLLSTAGDVDGDDLSVSNLQIMPPAGIDSVIYTLAGSTLTLDPTQFNHLNIGTVKLVFTYDVVDDSGDVTSNTLANTCNLTITGINDQPDAIDNACRTDEDTALTTGNLITDNTGSGLDSDVDDVASLTVQQIYYMDSELKVSGVVGEAFVLASGATLTVQEDGSLVYDPTTSTSHQALQVDDVLESFFYTIDDGSGADNSESEPAQVTIMVTAVNDSPEITAPETVSLDEDSSVKITGISVSDVDATGEDVTLTLSVTEGSISFASGIVDGVSADQITQVNSSSLSVTATLAEIQASLNVGALSYAGAAEFNGSDTLSIILNDLGNFGTVGALEASKSIAITVNPVNDAPTLTVPEAKSGNEDESLSLSGIVIADIDNESGSVSLSVSHGTLTFGDISGLSFDSGSNGESSMTVSGSINSLNSALATLEYTGALNFNGSDSLSVSFSDGELSVAGFVSITVNAVNDAPIIEAPANLALGEDTSVSVSGLSISDVDSETAELTLSVGQGTLTLADSSLLAAGSVNGSSSLTLSGSISAINAALANLVYAVNADFNGSDSLAVTVSDLGNTGLGGMQTDNTSVDITIEAIADEPTVSVSDVSGDEGTVQSLNISVTDIADGESVVIFVNGLPSGASLSAGVDLGNSWRLTLAELSGLTVTLPEVDSNTIFNATVSVVSSDGDSLATVDTPFTLSVSDIPAPVDPIDPIDPFDPLTPDPVDEAGTTPVVIQITPQVTYSDNSLTFVAGDTQLQFNNITLSEDALVVIATMFDANIIVDQEVADSGLLEAAINPETYDLSTLPLEEQQFIKDLMFGELPLLEALPVEGGETEVEEEEEESFSFATDEEALNELAQLDVFKEKLTQQDLDIRISLEDTLMGEFDCFRV
ncbi:MAG: tandem-95 repeat protein [Lentisphaerales bacterium]|nr:tandem-95 repeat protein [Lentisphaerales bacterium]